MTVEGVLASERHADHDDQVDRRNVDGDRH